MPGPTINLYSVPTGGAVRLDLPDYLQPPSGVTQMVVSRAVSGVTGLGAFTQLYSGSVFPTWIDPGDGLATSLDPSTQYVWQVADSRGATQTSALAPASSFSPAPDQLSQLLIRLLQGAVTASSPPSGIVKPTVTTQMPQGGWAAMPFVVVNQDLVQQSEVGIGEDVPNPDLNNDWTLWANAKRVWRVTVMSQDSEERDWYRDFLLSAFRAMKATVFSPIGLNVRHSFQAASYTDANEWDGHTPGFYGADLMMELDGVFPVAVLTNYGIIAEIDVTATTSGAVTSAVIT